MKNFYFTYGSNHLDKDGNSLGDCYTIIQAENEVEARMQMYPARDLSWSFSYPEDEAAVRMVSRWNLQHRSLESVTLHKNED